jgi:hypothetical protein
MKRFILLLTMAVFTIITISSCTCIRYTCMKYSQPAKDIRKPIRVKIKTKDLDGRKPKIVPMGVMLKHGTNQQVEWKIDQDVRFTINFDIEANKNSRPFETYEFNNQHNKSGRTVVDFDPGEKEKVYWYSVEVEGFEPVDPMIIIW